jgi:uncharacterized membrane protein YsdA (DUF1294 family)
MHPRASQPSSVKQSIIRPARDAVPPRRRGSVSAVAFATLALLLVAPGCALARLAPWIDWRILLGAPISLSVLAFFAYRSDKLRAEAGAWRIPESTLQIFGLVGGWPGAFLAQRKFRHKTSKTSFQVVYWSVVVAHQFVAVDFLSGWRVTSHVITALASRIA